MTLNLKWMAVAALFGAAVLASAQPGPGPRQGGPGMMRGGFGDGMLLMRSDVQKDLKLTDAQKKKLEGIAAEMRPPGGGPGGARPGGGGQGGNRPGGNRQGGGQGQPDWEAMRKRMEETEKKALAVLSPEQKARLKEIGIQMAGPMAYTRPEVDAALKLTGAQKNKLNDLAQKMGQANQQVMQRARNNEISREQARAAVERNRSAMQAEVDKVLTKEQRDKLAKMSGKKFAVDPNLGFGFGGRGMGGPGGGGRRGGGAA